MADWSSYSLEDFVLFSPRVYWRMFELQNAAAWPALLAGVAALILMAGALSRPSRALRLAAFVALGAVWVWVGLSFLGGRYAAINWAVAYVVPFFAVQGLLLFAAGFAGRAWLDLPGPTLRTGCGLLLIVYAVALHPFVAQLAGRPWQAAELFGIAPDPTAMATIGFAVLTIPAAGAWVVCAIPLLWCLASALTLYALDVPEAAIPLAAAVVGILGCSVPYGVPRYRSSSYRPPSAR